MNVMLPPAARNKLVGILGRLGSDFEGERSAAALLAARLVKSAGLGWDQVITGGAIEAPRPQGQAAGWRASAAFVLQHREILTEWEINFVRALRTREALSPKQHDVLARIVAKVSADGFTP